MDGRAPSDPAAVSTAERVCELCRVFYDLGWASGTGGGISIRDDRGIWVAPSGVQKERIAPRDVFLIDGAELEQAAVVQSAANPALRVSECTPLFLAAFRLRGAGAVLHSHSIWPVLATRLSCPDPAVPDEDGLVGELVCTGLEMQKGLRGTGCFDTLRVPIVANTPRESQLTERLQRAIERYPDVDAVMVLGHGVYVWGRDWVQAKTQAECLDYLCRAVVEGHRLGISFQPE
jgi:methylthioribulose-1-phosphate dehydratase